jgi:hypothetical protein
VQDSGPGGDAEEGAPVGLDLVVPLAPLHEAKQTHHSTFVRWATSVQWFRHFSPAPNYNASESKERPMADLEEGPQK